MTLTSPPRQTKLQIIHDSGHLFSEMRWEAAAPISPSPALWFSQEASCSLSANHVFPGGALPTHCSLCHLFPWLEIGPPQGSVPLLPRVAPGRGWASTAQGPTALRLSSLDQERVLEKDTKHFFFFFLLEGRCTILQDSCSHHCFFLWEHFCLLCRREGLYSHWKGRLRVVSQIHSQFRLMSWPGERVCWRESEGRISPT